MDQLHNRFTAEQVEALFRGYCQGTLDRPAVEETLKISRPRFFVLLKQYRLDPNKFPLACWRKTPTRPSVLPITSYNYSAIRDRLAKQGIKESSVSGVSCQQLQVASLK